MIAEARRQSAKLPLRRLPGVTIETTRNQLNAEIRTQLAMAETAYRELQLLLNEKQESDELSPLEQRAQRNSYFSRADVLYDLGRFEDAIQAYGTTTNRYQHEPEALEAYVQIASCQRQLKRDSEARGTLESAKVVLQGIHPEADFAATTRYTRKEWEQLLDWLTSL